VELKRLIPAFFVVMLIPLAVGETVPSISAENGEPLEGAIVRVTTPDCRIFKFTLAPSSPLTVGKVVFSKLDVEVVQWKGVLIGYKARVRVTGNSTLVVPELGTSIIRVLGSRRRGLGSTQAACPSSRA
jgi:hypothetical protein